jgi:hypothetical protein
MRHLRSKYELLYAPDAASLDDLDVARPAGSGVAAAAVDVGGYGLEAEADTAVWGMSPMGSAAEGGLGGGMAVGGMTAPAWKARKKGSPLTGLILMVGIVGGGALGIFLGLMILMWIRPESSVVRFFRGVLPGWMMPNVAPSEEVTPIPAVPPPAQSPPNEPSSFEPTPGTSTSMRPIPRDVSHALTMKVLEAARLRCG